MGPSRSSPGSLGEPFFTTKSASGGTGLGMAITSSLVRLHHGRLSFASEPGLGTRAIVELPCVPSGSEPMRFELHGSTA
jgi:two-component system, NtrC family, sensor kinase